MDKPSWVEPLEESLLLAISLFALITWIGVALNLLFQEQLYLSAAAVDAASSARLDELIGVSGALDQNSIALAEIFGAVKGEVAAQTLLDAWRGLVADLIQYAQGAQSAARADLDQRRPVIAAQLSLSSLPQPAADDLVRARSQTQLSVADAIVSRNPTLTAQRLRLAAAASDELARPLAAELRRQTGQGRAIRRPPRRLNLESDV